MRPGRGRLAAVLAASAALASGSNLLLRYAMGGLGHEAGLALLAAAIVTPAVVAGIVGYGLSQLLWLEVLASARLGAAFPAFVGATFVAVMGGSALVLGEPLGGARLGGALLVAAGIVVSEWARPTAAAGRGQREGETR
jgi:multidrug transporter EmrE-like cation transporter